MSPRTIVAWNGSSSSRAALLWALHRESALGGGTTLAVVVDSSFAPFGEATTNRLREAARAAAEAEVAWARATRPGVALDIQLLEGKPEATLIELTAPDRLLIVGADSRSAAFKAPLGYRVASHASGPVVLVPVDTFEPGGPVVAGIDGSDRSDRALEFSAAEAARLGTRLEIVHGSAASTSEAEALVRRAVERVREAHPGLQVTGTVDESAETAALLRRSAGAALLVVGTHGHGPLRRLLFGSVSHVLSEVGSCPLAIVASDSD